MRYCVEHREHGTTEELGHLDAPAPHPAALDPFVSVVLRRGQDGQLVLIDEATGREVLRRKVRPFDAKAGDRFEPRPDREAARRPVRPFRAAGEADDRVT
jgi:hypothetical protein